MTKNKKETFNWVKILLELSNTWGYHPWRESLIENILCYQADDDQCVKLSILCEVNTRQYVVSCVTYITNKL